MNTLLTALLLTVTPREDQVLFQGNVQGSETVAPAGTDSVRAEYSFNDRGRGDHINFFAAASPAVAAVRIECRQRHARLAESGVSQSLMR